MSRVAGVKTKSKSCLTLVARLAGARAWGGRGARRRLRRIVVEAAFLDGDDVFGFELILLLLVVIEMNGAPFGADAAEHLHGLEDVFRLGIALDDRHLVILIIAIGNRHRVGRDAARQEPDQSNRTRKTQRRNQTQRVHPLGPTSFSSSPSSSSLPSLPSSPS